MSLLRDKVDKLFERQPASRLGYRLLRAKVLEAITESEKTVITIKNIGITFSPASIAIMLLIFFLGIALGHSLDEIRALISSF